MMKENLEELEVFNFSNIPNNWKNVKINEVAEIKGGFAFDSTKFKESGKYQVIKMSNLYENQLDLSRSQSFLEELTDQEKEYVLTHGDIIITLTGTIGKRDYGYSYQIEAEENLLLNQRVAKIKVTKGDPTYVSYQIKTNRFLNQFFFSARGGTGNQANVGTQDLASMKVILPPLPEQKAIAQVLSTADAAIHTTEKLIAQKELRKKWLMQQLLTGKKRLKGFGGEWKDVRLKDVTTNFSRRNKDLVDAKVYSVTNKSGFVLQSEHFEGKVAGEDLSNYKIVKKHEFAYNPARINVGSLAYFEEEIGVISSLYVCFKTTKDVLDYFLLQFLQIDHTKHRIEALGEGGVRVYLWYDLFSKIKIRIPSIEEQTAIAQVLQAADKEISLLKAKAEKLREQKKGLMQVLLTGKIRLNLDSLDLGIEGLGTAKLNNKKIK